MTLNSQNKRGATMAFTADTSERYSMLKHMPAQANLLSYEGIMLIERKIDEWLAQRGKSLKQLKVEPISSEKQEQRRKRKALVFVALVIFGILLIVLVHITTYKATVANLTAFTGITCVGLIALVWGVWGFIESKPFDEWVDLKWLVVTSKADVTLLNFFQECSMLDELQFVQRRLEFRLQSFTDWQDILSKIFSSPKGPFFIVLAAIIVNSSLLGLFKKLLDPAWLAGTIVIEIALGFAVIAATSFGRKDNVKYILMIVSTAVSKLEQACDSLA